MDGEGQPLSVLTLSIAYEYRLYETVPQTSLAEEMASWLRDFPLAWAESGGIGFTHHQSPVLVTLKPTATLVRVKQYPLRPEAIQGITPHIEKLSKAGILKPCHSTWSAHAHEETKERGL